MKTPQQIKFEHLIISIIQSNAYIMERKGLLDDFKEDSDICYDVFCEKVYEFFQERRTGSLVIDERGRVHTDDVIKKAHHVYFNLLSDEDYIEDSNDVVDYINLALKRLEAQVDTIYRVVN